MNNIERRKEILDILRKSSSPVPAKQLAARFDVSRQVIVQDLAVIRASTSGILSTNRGYLMENDVIYTREFKVRHDEPEIERELNLIVDCGGCVKNISISHRAYGRVRAQMDIRSRQDVQEFVGRMVNSKSSLLANATSGYHYHLVEADSEARLDLIEEKLREAGFLQELLPWEVAEQ